MPLRLSGTIVSGRTVDATTEPADQSLLHRRLFFVLALTALLYSLLAGLRTVKDNDLGWQMATGRWVVQHHQAPPVEAFSYTAQGSWIYPVGAGLVFYWAYLLGGYPLISWLGAFACCATVALLLRRGSAATAALAILAVPVIAWRTAPRADLFTVVLFAAFLSLLWQYHETSNARLWLLPLLMAAWVNLHLGFASGLALLAMYALLELSEALMGAQRRRDAFHRLRRALPPLACTVLATLINPWGWNIYRALIYQQSVMPQHQALFQEWRSVPLDWSVVRESLSLRHTGGTIYLLLALAVFTGVIALFRDRPGAGVVLLLSTVPALRYSRMGAIFAAIVVVIGGSVLYAELQRLSDWLRTPRLRQAIAIAAVVFIVAMSSARCFDLLSNRFYYAGTEESNFGAGLGWWFPARAAAFIEREQLPGEVFGIYTEGGYLAWRLGPARRDYIDGRGIPFGIERILRETELRQNPPDSAVWQQEIQRYNINTVILPIGRYQGIHFVRLPDFCNSPAWQLVYMDEVGAVFVRRTPATQPVLARFSLTCATAPIPPQAPAGNGAEALNAWANAASVLAALGRNSEALAAAGRALEIFPDSALLHSIRADVFLAEGQADAAEKEYLASIAADPSEAAWNSLADLYRKQGRTQAQIDAQEHAARLSRKPWSSWLQVGYTELDMGKPQDALKAFDRAAWSSFAITAASHDPQFPFMLAQGRARAWNDLGDLPKATSYQEQAAELKPNLPQAWLQLAEFYRRQGRTQDANRASARAAALSFGPVR